MCLAACKNHGTLRYAQFFKKSTTALSPVFRSTALQISSIANDPLSSLSIISKTSRAAFKNLEVSGVESV